MLLQEPGTVRRTDGKLQPVKPAPTAKPVQGPGLKPQAWPGAGTGISKAVGAKPLAPSTWKPTAVGNAPSGVPKFVSDAMGPKFETAAKEYSTPTSAERQVLAARGWQLPPGAEAEPSASLFKTEDPKALASYSYLPEKEEIERIEEVYRGMPGYTPPAEESASTSNMFVSMMARGGPLSTSGKVKEEVEETPIVNEVQSAALTWEEYDRLNEDQRKAVDFNTLLVRARETDLTHSHAYDEQERKTYDEEVKTIFGEAGGSEKYAPNTVALLKQIDFKAVGQDLDEYLSLERAVTEEMLKNFKIEDAPQLKQLGEGRTSYEGVRSRSNQTAATVTAVVKSATAIQESMTNAKTVLDTFYATMEQGRLPILDTLGGVSLKAGEAAPGFPFMGQTYKEGDEAGAKSAFFNNAYASAAAGKMNEVWAAIEGATSDEKQELFDYLNQRSEQELRWGRPEGMFVNTPEVSYANPENTRANIGFGG